jgi:hypothetical protein
MRASTGWRLRSTIVDSGLFHCPIDGGDRFYDLTDVRRWFMPFGLALIPGRRLGKYVVCVGCGSSYTEDVLVIPTAAEMLDRFERAALALMQALYSASGEDPKARARVLKAARGVISPERSLVDVMVAGCDLGELESMLRGTAEFMDVIGREHLLRVGIGAVARDRRIASCHLDVLERAGAGLLLPNTTVDRLITTAAPLS